MPLLEIMDGSPGGRRVPVLSTRVLIGRGDGCDLILRDGRVSREHAQLLELPSGKWVLQDLGSENGVHVAGACLREHELSDGDLFRLGKTEIRFHTRNLRERESTEDIAAIGSLAFDATTTQVEEPTELDTLGEDVVRADMRRRLRRLERQLLDRECEMAELARDNAMLRRMVAVLHPAPATSTRGPARLPATDGVDAVLAAADSTAALSLNTTNSHWLAAADSLQIGVAAANGAPTLHTDLARAAEPAPKAQAALFASAHDQAEARDVLTFWEYALRALPGTRLKPLLELDGWAALGRAAVSTTEDWDAAALAELALGRGWTGGALVPSLARRALFFVVMENRTAGGERAISSLLESFASVARTLLPEAVATVSCTRAPGQGIRLIVLLGGLPGTESSA